MTDRQWTELCMLVAGTRETKEAVAGFIIDSPWLPQWSGVSILDYLAHDQVWFDANLKAVETFPEAIFLPGFWAEYGMCTEPSAFGARCMFPENEFPERVSFLSKPLLAKKITPVLFSVIRLLSMIGSTFSIYIPVTA